MALDDQLSDFMPHVVTIYPYSAKNNYGEDTQSATGRTARAYVEPNKNLSVNGDRADESKPTRAYIADTTITLRDKIVLADGSIPKIGSIETHIEVLGLEHTVVVFI